MLEKKHAFELPQIHTLLDQHSAIVCVIVNVVEYAFTFCSALVMLLVFTWTLVTKVDV